MAGVGCPKSARTEGSRVAGRARFLKEPSLASERTLKPARSGGIWALREVFPPPAAPNYSDGRRRRSMRSPGNRVAPHGLASSETNRAARSFSFRRAWQHLISCRTHPSPYVEPWETTRRHDERQRAHNKHQRGHQNDTENYPSPFDHKSAP
jgi:hypothetical protein